MINKETEFYNIKTEDLTYFKIVSINFKKTIGEKSEWDNLFTVADELFNKVNFKFILIIDIKDLTFPGVNPIKRFSDILKKYPDNIDNYLIESSVIIPTTILSKTIVNILFTFYNSRRPVHIKYSYEDARNDIEKTINQFTKN